MYELMVEEGFSAAHQLRGYMGKCENLHGHNWKINAYVLADRLNDIDLAIDFHVLKHMLQDILFSMDHAFLNDRFPFTEINPSSENMAKWIYDSLQKKLDALTTDQNGGHVRVSAITVWESDTASATYYED